MARQHILMTVPPIVFNERLAKRLRTLDSGAQALAVATKGLSERLDQHEANEGPLNTAVSKIQRRYSTE